MRFRLFFFFLSFRFRPARIFSCEVRESKRAVLPVRNNRRLVRAEVLEHTPETNCCCGLAPRKKTRGALFTRCRAQAPKPMLTASGLAATRRAECARVNLSWVFRMLAQCRHPSPGCCLTHCCCCCCCSLTVRTYLQRGARRVRFLWCPGPSPRQPTAVCSRRIALTADCASGAKRRLCITI